MEMSVRLPSLRRNDRSAMGYWKKHPRKEFEAVLDQFHELGWRIDDPPKYYRLRCPCGLHMRWFHLTPSNPNYGVEALQWAKRTCPRTSEEAR